MENDEKKSRAVIKILIAGIVVVVVVIGKGKL